MKMVPKLQVLVITMITVNAYIGPQLEERTFQHCIKSQPNPGIVGCVGRQALSSLHTIQEIDNYTIANGFMMIRDERLASRSVTNFLDADPMDFRGILENAGAIVGQRTLQWDLGMIQPGLCLRIGPSVESTSMLEFIMDPNHDRGDRYLHEEPSTARILAKQFIVPFLLGLKFNLITILPLFFAGIILLCKKAAFLGKIALFVSGLLGYGSLFSLGNLGSGWGGGWGGYGGGYGGVGGVVPGPGFINGHRPILGDGVSVSAGGGYNHHDFEGGSAIGSGYYRDDIKRGENNLPSVGPLEKDMLSDHFYNFEKKVLLQDRNSKLFEKELDNEDRSGYRNFAWKTN